MYRLSKEEIRIIEETKSSGEPGSGRVRVWPIVALVLFIVVVALLFKFAVSWLS